VCAASARRKEALSAGLTPLFFLPIQYPKDKTNELRADMRITPRNSALGTTPFQNIRIRDRVTDI
jgi:hypothetical protein